LYRQISVGFLAIIFLFPSLCGAGYFSVSPVKLFLDEGEKASLIKVKNKGEESVTIQVEAMVWSQNDAGEDIYTSTKEIILFPKIVAIGKGEETVIRIGVQRTGTTEKEQAYRIFVQELPVSKPGVMALKFAVRMTIPIFIQPAEQVQGQSLQKVGLRDGRFFVSVLNSGNSHLMVNKVLVTGVGDDGKEIFSQETNGWYVLSEATRTFSVNLPEEGCRQARSLKTVVTVAKSQMETEIEVDPNRCLSSTKP
jgi:fimbrial chaperone protein